MHDLNTNRRTAGLAALAPLLLGLGFASEALADRDRSADRMDRERLECAAGRGHLTRCAADQGMIVTSARLLRQDSRAGCRLGDSWGHDRHGLWVRNGCSGHFEIVLRPAGPERSDRDPHERERSTAWRGANGQHGARHRPDDRAHLRRRGPGNPLEPRHWEDPGFSSGSALDPGTLALLQALRDYRWLDAPPRPSRRPMNRRLREARLIDACAEATRNRVRRNGAWNASLMPQATVRRGRVADWRVEGTARLRGPRGHDRVDVVCRIRDGDVRVAFR